MFTKLGNVSKDSKYLNRIKTVTIRKGHARNQGVKFQAHHIISAEGMKQSGLGSKIEKYGYDINKLPNLAYIPCTLDGACYLGVQPHRGDHTALADPEESYDDDDEPPRYHNRVSRKLQELGLPIDKACQSDADSEHVIHSLNGLSKRILGLIQNYPGRMPLTKIAKHFSPESPIGCGGVKNVGAHTGLSHCPCKRHHMSSVPGEGMFFKCDGRYELLTGKEEAAYALLNP